MVTFITIIMFMIISIMIMIISIMIMIVIVIVAIASSYRKEPATVTVAPTSKQKHGDHSIFIE